MRNHVLCLSYTAWDLAAFARDMGHVYAEDEARPKDAAVGDAKPPFRSDEAVRRQLRARLDALYFILYGVTDMADVEHVLSTFPIVEPRGRTDRRRAEGSLTCRLKLRRYRFKDDQRAFAIRYDPTCPAGVPPAVGGVRSNEGRTKEAVEVHGREGHRDPAGE